MKGIFEVSRRFLLLRKYFCSNVVGKESLTSVSSLLNTWENIFNENKIPEPSLSIKHIMTHLLGLTSITDLSSVSSKNLSEVQIKDLERFCQCRLARMPVQFIIGEWDFCDLTVKLRPPVFIPRPETEELVQIITNKLKSRQTTTKILEIGCGSGVISLALLKALPRVKCVAVDQSKFACELTLHNARLNNLEDRIQIHHGKLTTNGISDFVCDEKFDVLVSNPPYISLKELPNLATEIILYEDLKSLDGGLDGLDVVRNILKLAPNVLNINANIYLEVDPTHPNMIRGTLLKNNLNIQFIETYKDFTKLERFVELRLITL